MLSRSSLKLFIWERNLSKRGNGGVEMYGEDMDYPFCP